MISLFETFFEKNKAVFSTLEICATTLIFILFSLDSYNFYQVPLSWVALFLSLGFGYKFLKFDFSSKSFDPFVGLFILYITAITLYSLFHHSSDSIVFVFRRLMVYFSFAILYMHFKTLDDAKFKKVLSALMIWTSVLAIYGIYVYFAQVYGLPEIMRNRSGTAGPGSLQPSTFSFPIHRAMGTFREPGLYAAFLVFMYWMALDYQHRVRRLLFHSLIVGSILLTGSLSALISLIFIPLSLRIFRGVKLFTADNFMVGISALLIFAVVVKPGLEYKDEGVYGAEQEFGLMQSAFSHSFNRTSKILHGGVAKSNRDYVWNYIQVKEASLFGEGLGYSNMSFANSLNLRGGVSFLSFFVNILYSGGFIAICILILLMVKLFSDMRRNGQACSDSSLALFLAVMFFSLVLYEEPNPFFALALSMVVRT